METKKLIELFNKYNIGKKDRTVLLGMVAEYRKVKLNSNVSKIKRAAAWLILKKIWDYFEDICT